MRYLFSIFLFGLSLQIFAQAITVSSAQLNFGNTFENAPDSLPLTIANPSNNTVTIQGIKFYRIYGSQAFSVHDSIFTLAPFASQTVYVKFTPLHNVPHNSELVVLNNSKRGNVAVDLIGQGKYSKTYYATTENLTEQTLKDTLQAITGRGYVSQGYNGGRDKMYMNIDNKKVNGQGTAVNTIECVYTGRNAVGYTSRSNCQSAFSFNTEHTYPQGYFGSAEPMQSDLFHLFPTDDNANTVRSSFRFGVVTGTPTWTDGGSKFGGVFFEPRDQHKGIVARAMFYFVVRYQNYQGFLTTQEATLRNWLHAFPPSVIEKKRDADIFFYQKNHNPFIDYPQFVDRITSISNVSVAPTILSLDQTDSLIDYGFVPAFSNTTYNYVIVNKGNTTLNLSNFGLSNSSFFSFANGTGSNTSLLPGEDLTIQIALATNSSDSLVEFLSFDSNIPNANTFQIPIFANYYQLPLKINETVAMKPELLLFPNPNRGELNLQYDLDDNSPADLLIYNSYGEIVHQQRLNNSGLLQVSLIDFADGIYTCSIKSDAGIVHKKLVLLK
jgi:hypothetical protein